jgi:hypothetical protein
LPVGVRRRAVLAVFLAALQQRTGLLADGTCVAMAIIHFADTACPLDGVATSESIWAACRFRV